MINNLIQKIFRDDKKKFIFDNKIDLRETDIILGLNPFISRDELLLLKCNVLYKFDKFKTNDYFVQKENRDKYEDLALHLFQEERGVYSHSQSLGHRTSIYPSPMI